MYPDIYVNKPADVPTVEHYAIFEGGSHYTPGDERSRTNPGHGYPESSDPYIKYEAYLTKEKLMLAIKELEECKYSKKEYKVCKITPMVVNKTVDISVG